jgi:hypothetical protein
MMQTQIPLSWRTTDLDFQGHTFKIFSSQFSDRSPRFKTDHSNSNPVVLHNEVSVISMEAFLTFIHNDPFTITPSNYSDLRLLSEFWGVADLTQLLNDFLQNPINARNVVISSINLGIERGRNTSDEEQILSANLFDYLNDSEFLSLDLQIIQRIVDPKIGEIESPQVFPDNLFEFVLKALKQIGNRASILLKSVSIETLSTEQLRILCDCPQFDWSFIKRNVGRRIAD